MPTRELLRPLASSKTLQRVALYALGVGCYAVIPVWFFLYLHQDPLHLPAEFHAALTLFLGWLLVFRTNQAYARWWEARKLWGALVNVSRNLAIKTHHLVQLSVETRAGIFRDLIAFPRSLRDHLRNDASLEKLPGYEEVDVRPKHVPSYLAGSLYSYLRDARTRGELDGDDLRVIDTELHCFLDICGGCERIYKTPIAASYRIFARQCIALYLVSLPWGIVSEFRMWTIPLTIMMAYFMMGLETVAEHVEEPFGYDEDDLDLDALCDTIERSVSEIVSGSLPSPHAR